MTWRATSMCLFLSSLMMEGIVSSSFRAWAMLLRSMSVIPPRAETTMTWAPTSFRNQVQDVLDIFSSFKEPPPILDHLHSLSSTTGSLRSAGVLS